MSAKADGGRKMKNFLKRGRNSDSGKMDPFMERDTYWDEDENEIGRASCRERV